MKLWIYEGAYFIRGTLSVFAAHFQFNFIDKVTTQ